MHIVQSIPSSSPSALIACPSVTPATGAVFDVLEAALAPLGFDVHRFVLGEAPDGPVENLVAIRGIGRAAFRLRRPSRRGPAGRRLDQRPVRRRSSTDGVLIGRGANDMKSAIAAFVAAAARLPEHRGTLSLLITGDEEGPATYGTPAIIDWLRERDIRARHDPDRRADQRDARSATRSRSAGAARSTCGSRCPARRATSPTRTAPTIRSAKLARIVAALDAMHARRRQRRLPAVEPRIHRHR